MVRHKLYFLRSSSDILVDVRTSPAVSPKQYSSTLTCRVSLSASRAVALRNSSKRRFQWGHWSGFLKSKAGGGSSRNSAIPPLPPCSVFQLKYSDLQPNAHTIYTHMRMTYNDAIQITNIHIRYIIVTYMHIESLCL